MKRMLSSSVDDTLKLGARLGKLLKKGGIIALSGEFGTGKTTLIKGIAAGLGVKETKYVNSPSFVIVKEYRGRIPIYHFDVYRLDGLSGMETVGYADYFYGDVPVTRPMTQGRCGCASSRTRPATALVRGPVHPQKNIVAFPELSP